MNFDKKTIVIAVVALIILVGLYFWYSNRAKQSCLSACSQTHSQTGDDYVWLNPLGHGKVTKVYFEEPVGSGKWTLYDDHWWNIHCKAIDHSPDNLVASHTRAFINPGRFARLMFFFEDGTQTEPTVQFYQLEADYFRNRNLC
jgi:hypothetical protein